MNELLTVLGAVFLGEIGDKTMLVCIWLTTVYSVRHVLSGVIPSCFAVPLAGIALGVLAKTWLPEVAIRGLGAALFFYLVYWSIKEAQEGDEVQKKTGRFGAVLTSFVVFFVAEFADRTQMITIAATTQGGDWVLDWLGSAFGLIAANLVAIYLFKRYGRHVPRRAVMYIGGLLFLASGVWLVLDMSGISRPYSIAVAIAMIVFGLNRSAYRWSARKFGFAGS